MTLDPKRELEEFRARKRENLIRNQGHALLRKAWEDIYSWPPDWSPYKEKITYPLVKKAVLTHANFLMGRGFTTQVEPLGPNPPQRVEAQQAEKALFALVERCAGFRSLWRSAVLGSLLGTSGFKCYTVGEGSEMRACFSAIQPEFLYAVPKGDDYTDAVKVFYAYSLDRLEAAERYNRPPDSFKSERDISQQDRADYLDLRTTSASPLLQERRIPVVEVWTHDSYMLWVGGEVISNGDNPYGCGIPFVIIPNIDSLKSIEGLPDTKALLDINNHLNWLLSSHFYNVLRYLDPTLIWYGAPANVADIIPDIVGGGGVIPANRPGAKLEYLQYLGQGPDISDLLDRMRAAGIDMTGLNDLSWSGQSGASIQTGPSLEVNFTNVQSTLAAKQENWKVGLRQLFKMLLSLGSGMGDIAVVDDPAATSRGARGVRLNGKTIGDHRVTKITFAGLMPKDDATAAHFELEKHGAGVQSMWTTLENLGFDFPQDELDRIRQETQDSGLKPDVDAMRTRAQAMMTTAQAKAQQPELAGDQGVEGDLDLDIGPQPEGEDLANLTDTPPGFGTAEDGAVFDDGGRELGDLGARLARNRAQQLNELPDEEEGGLGF